MNDDDLMTAVRNSFTSVHVTPPVEQITRRGRALRARRRSARRGSRSGTRRDLTPPRHSPGQPPACACRESRPRL